MGYGGNGCGKGKTKAKGKGKGIQIQSHKESWQYLTKVDWGSRFGKWYFCNINRVTCFH